MVENVRNPNPKGDRMNLQESAQTLMDGDALSDAEIEALLMQSADALEGYADAIGESTDYLIEAALEAAAERDALLTGLESRVRDYWLKLDAVPGGSHYEVAVRAAEFLAAHMLRAEPNADALLALANAEDWRQRLVCAWVVRDRNDPTSETIKNQLSQDPFEDDNGIYLVREGAGFTDDFA